MLPASLLPATAASDQACPIGCPLSSTRHARSSQSARSSFSGSPRPGRTALGDRIRRDRGSVAFAERRSGLRWRYRVRAWHRRRLCCRGNHQIRGAARPCKHSRPFASPSVFSSYRSALPWPSSRRPGSDRHVHRHGLQLHPLLSPTNPMTYDTAQFYNAALAIVVGCGLAPLAFRLLPPLSPALRARRLLALTLRDLRRLAIARLRPTVGGLGGPHVRPARGIAGPGRAVAARATAGGAVRRHRDHPPSPRGPAPWAARGARRRARCLRAGKQRNRDRAAASTRPPPRLRSRRWAGDSHRASGARSYPDHLRGALPSMAPTSTRERCA